MIDFVKSYDGRIIQFIRTRFKYYYITGMVVVIVVVVSHIQPIRCQPEKTTLHSGQSRSWSGEEGKEDNMKSLAAHSPPPPTLLVWKK